MTMLGRFGALSGAMYVVLVGVGNALSMGPGAGSEHPTGQEDIATLSWLQASAAGQVGVSLELLGFAAFMLFVGYLCSRVRGAGWLAAAAAVGGIVSIAVKLGSAAPMFAGYMLVEDISPETARVLTDMNSVAFVVDWLPTGVFVACAAAAALRTRTVGGILGWSGVVVGSVSVIGTAITGLHVVSATPVPFVLCILWILLVSVRLGVQRTSRAAGDVTPAADELGV